ncbi:MAG: hypothetical protein HUJ54_11170 [Erysipelotrichaceae bacterium]|nr:hypothetical protein [Erysipelotrichaceae bacterium]
MSAVARYLQREVLPGSGRKAGTAVPAVTERTAGSRNEAAAASISIGKNITEKNENRQISFMNFQKLLLLLLKMSSVSCTVWNFEVFVSVSGNRELQAAEI